VADLTLSEGDREPLAPKNGTKKCHNHRPSATGPAPARAGAPQRSLTHYVGQGPALDDHLWRLSQGRGRPGGLLPTPRGLPQAQHAPLWGEGLGGSGAWVGCPMGELLWRGWLEHSFDGGAGSPGAAHATAGWKVGGQRCVGGSPDG